MKPRHWFLLSWLLILLSACSTGRDATQQASPTQLVAPQTATVPASPVPAATASLTSTPTSTATLPPTDTPTPEVYLPFAYPENPAYLIQVDTRKWEVSNPFPDRSVSNSDFLVHLTLPNCKIGVVPATEFGSLPAQPATENIGGKNWQIMTAFGYYYLLSNQEINFSLTTPYENEAQAQACAQDGREILASLAFADASPIVETPAPTYTPDVAYAGWYPCGEAYPLSYLHPGGEAYVSTADGQEQRIRAEAGTGQTLLGSADPGAILHILDVAPQCVDGYVWWRVEVDNRHLVGWTAEGDGTEQWLWSFRQFWEENPYGIEP